MSSANRKLQCGRPPMDTDDSGLPVSSASSTASSAKQSFSDDEHIAKKDAPAASALEHCLKYTLCLK